MVALCFLLAFTPLTAYDFSATILRCARTSLFKSTERTPTTDARDPPRKVKCALGGTLLPLGVCASHRVRTQRNDTAPRTREFARATEMPSDHATREHGHIRARALTARAALTQAQVLLLLPVQTFSVQTSRQKSFGEKRHQFALARHATNAANSYNETKSHCLVRMQWYRRPGFGEASRSSILPFWTE